MGPLLLHSQVGRLTREAGRLSQALRELSRIPPTGLSIPILDVIKELARSGMTMLAVTYEMGFAREVADRIAFFDFGELIEANTPEAFFDSPKHDRTKLFLSQILQH